MEKYHPDLKFCRANFSVLNPLIEHQLPEIGRQMKVGHFMLYRRPRNVMRISAFTGRFIKISPPGYPGLRLSNYTVSRQRGQWNPAFYGPGNRIIDWWIDNRRKGMCNFKLVHIRVGEWFSRLTVIPH